MDKKVSVIIPVYNVENYLEDCLESVRAQTLEDIEIICVDDKSTDQSASIIRNYQAMDQRIIFLQNEQNGGLSYARNQGSKAASGEYIYYLDSDDYIQPNALLELYQMAKREDLDVVFFDSLMFFENKDLEERMGANDLFRAKEKYDGILTGRELFRQWYEKSDIREPVWIQFYKREFLEKNQIVFYEGILHEDMLFTYRVLMSSKRVRCMNQSYHHYRIRENAITTSECSEKHIVGLMISYFEIMEHWNHDPYDGEVKDAVAHYLDRIRWSVKQDCHKFPNQDAVLEALTEKPAVRKMFQMILNEKAAQKIYGDWGNVDWDYLCGFEKIVIYGAGVIGMEALKQIGEGHGVSAFTVTDRPKHLHYQMGLPVYQIDRLPAEFRDPKTVLAIAARKSYQTKMQKTAEALGYQNIVVLPLRD